MKIYLATYDLAAPDADYEGVETELAACAIGEMLHFQKSVWLLASTKTAREIRDAVSPALQTGDKLFLTQLAVDDWAGWGTKTQAWIAEHRSAKSA